MYLPQYHETEENNRWWARALRTGLALRVPKYCLRAINNHEYRWKGIIMI